MGEYPTRGAHTVAQFGETVTNRCFFLGGGRGGERGMMRSKLATIALGGMGGEKEEFRISPTVTRCFAG